MGLSTEERYSKIVNVLSEMHQLGRFTDYRFKVLNALLDKLWPTFLSRSSNSMHWIVGSDASSNELSEMSLLRVSFEVSRDRFYKTSTAHCLNSESWHSKYLPKAKTLLPGESGRVWTLLHMIDFYYYAANRYDDEFSSSVQPVTDVISTLRGELHHIFVGDKQFHTAWMMQALCEKAFVWQDEDLITEAGKVFCWHHHLTASGQDYSTVCDWFGKWQTVKQVSAPQRLRCVLAMLSKSGFYYAHEHEKLLAMAGEWNTRPETGKRDIISLDWLARELSVRVEPKLY